jgi:hypothetical protein
MFSCWSYHSGDEGCLNEACPREANTIKCKATTQRSKVASLKAHHKGEDSLSYTIVSEKLQKVFFTYSNEHHGSKMAA